MKKEIKNKKILIIAATHGDEAFSIPILKKLSKEFKNFDWIVGNPRALNERKRFIKDDLNRAAPGNQKAKSYEVRRAYEIMRKAEKYEVTLDIHGTVSSSGIFTIVTNPTPENILLAYSLPIQKIVIWGSRDNARTFGPLSRYMGCAVGIECGPKNSLAVQKKLYGQLKKILDKGSYSVNPEVIRKKELYQVFGELSQKDVNRAQKLQLKDFREVSINGQIFFPLLVNQYVKEKIICYKMKKVDFYQKFSFPY